MALVKMRDAGVGPQGPPPAAVTVPQPDLQPKGQLSSAPAVELGRLWVLPTVSLGGKRGRR